MMKQFWTVFRFTYMDAVRKKVFIVSTAILLVVILIACLLPNIIALFSDDESESAEYTGAVIYLQDEKNLLPGFDERLSALGYSVCLNADDAMAKDDVLNGNASAYVVITPDEEALIYIKDFMHAPDTGAIADAADETLRVNALRAAGADEEILSILSESLPVYEQALGNMDLTGYTFGIVASMLMFFAVYFYGISVANSVATEKTSRVMETLVVSAKPSSIMLGKCAATGAAGLTQMAGIILYGVIMYNLLVPEGTMIFGMPLSFSGVNAASLTITILYFLLGYALYSLLYAVCGATVSRIEDVSPALMPISMVSMVSFYLGYFTSIMGSGQGWVEWAARYVPFASPFGMPFRLLNGSVTVEMCIISLLIIAVSIVIAGFISIRLYKAGVMHYGNRLKIKDLIKGK